MSVHTMLLGLRNERRILMEYLRCEEPLTNPQVLKLCAEITRLDQKIALIENPENGTRVICETLTFESRMSFDISLKKHRTNTKLPVIDSNWFRGIR